MHGETCSCSTKCSNYIKKKNPSTVKWFDEFPHNLPDSEIVLVILLETIQRTMHQQARVTRVPGINCYVSSRTD